MLNLTKKYNFFIFISIITILLFTIIFLILPFDFTSNQIESEVVISYADNISESHQYVIDKFNDEYKGKIRVKTIDLPFRKFSTNERKELLTRSLRSKSNKLDVFAVDLIWSTRFARWAEDLTSQFDSEEINSILPTALASCYYNDKFIAVPFYLDIGLMYYRKDLIEQLPNSQTIIEKLKSSITWEEFLNLSKNFNMNENPFYVFPADNYEGLICSFIEILHNYDSTFFDKPEIDLESESVRKTIILLSDLINKHSITPPEVTDYEENTCYKYFINNEGVFLRGWPSFTKDYKNILMSTKINSLLEKAALPHIKGTEPHSVYGGWNMMISKYSENKKEALEFVKYMIKEETQKYLYGKGAYLPVVKKLYEDPEFLNEFPSLIYEKKLLSKGIHRPFINNYTKLSDIISYYTNQVLKRNMTIDAALRNANISLKSGELIIR